VLSASFDKSIKLWDGVKGTFIATFRNHVGPVFQVAWSSDSRLFVTGSKDSTLKVRLVAALVIAAGSGACERAMGCTLPYQPLIRIICGMQPPLGLHVRLLALHQLKMAAELHGEGVGSP
jgi:hypothetical protein